MQGALRAGAQPRLDPVRAAHLGGPEGQTRPGLHPGGRAAALLARRLRRRAGLAEHRLHIAWSLVTRCRAAQGTNSRVATVVQLGRGQGSPSCLGCAACAGEAAAPSGAVHAGASGCIFVRLRPCCQRHLQARTCSGTCGSASVVGGWCSNQAGSPSAAAVALPRPCDPPFEQGTSKFTASLLVNFHHADCYRTSPRDSGGAGTQRNRLCDQSAGRPQRYTQQKLCESPWGAGGT